MADTSIKVGLTLKTDQFKKDVQDAVKDAKKELQTLNGEEILTPESIKKQVVEREKFLREHIKKTIESNSAWGNDAEALYKQWNTEKKKSALGGEIGGEFIHNGVPYETPLELQKVLEHKMQEQQIELERLRLAEETKKVEEAITKENEAQAQAIENTNKERKDNVLDTMGQGAKEAAKIAGSAEAAEASSGAVASGMLEAAGIIGVVVAVVKGLLIIITFIFNFIMDCINMVVSDNEEIQHQIAEIKAMIESIYYTVGTLLLDAVKWVLNAIVEALRFIQHVVYALTKVDILKYTADRLAKNMKSAADSAREMRKQLMGFDEANVISDTGGTGTLGNQGLNLDLSIDENYFEKLWKKLTDFFENIKKKWQEIKEKGGEQWSLLCKGIEDKIEGLKKQFTGMWEILEGGWHVVHGLITGDWDEMEKGFEEIVQGIQDWLDGKWLEFQGDFEIFCGSIYGIFYHLIEEQIKPALLDAWEWIVQNIIGEENAQKIYDTLEKIYNWVNDYIVTPITNFYYDVIKPLLDEYAQLKNPFHQTSMIEIDVKGKGKSLEKTLEEAASLVEILNPGTVQQKISNAKRIVNEWGFDNGGIILAQPGHGVPVGSAIMSERRSEAIIPFENPTAMEKIGEAIGRYVNIAIQNEMVVDGRVLASATNNQLNKERFLMNR